MRATCPANIFFFVSLLKFKKLSTQQREHTGSWLVLSVLVTNGLVFHLRHIYVIRTMSMKILLW